MLELGCGDGGNLVPMALALPDARFVGIDLRRDGDRARPRARRRARAGEPHARGDRDRGVRPAAGGFDYVIAHGVYSWVAPPVRDRLLALCRERLRPRRRRLRQLQRAARRARAPGAARHARFHTAELDDPRERVEQARALLRFLLEGSPAEHELGALMRGQAERCSTATTRACCTTSSPRSTTRVYFHEFVAHAGAHGLQYLAEADFFEMQIGAAPEPVLEALLAVEDLVRREQYLDFLKGRMFRQTLLCRAEARDRPHAAPRGRGAARRLVTGASPGPPGADGRGVFEGPGGSTLTTDQPSVIAALERAAETWPAAVWVRDPRPGGAAVCDALLRGYAANLLQLHACPPRLAHRPGERPGASPLARLQAAEGEL